MSGLRKKPPANDKEKIADLENDLKATREQLADVRKYWLDEQEKRRRLELVVKATAIQLAAVAGCHGDDIPF